MNLRDRQELQTKLLKKVVRSLESSTDFRDFECVENGHNLRISCGDEFVEITLGGEVAVQESPFICGEGLTLKAYLHENGIKAV